MQMGNTNVKPMKDPEIASRKPTVIVPRGQEREELYSSRSSSIDIQYPHISLMICDSLGGLLFIPWL